MSLPDLHSPTTPTTRPQRRWPLILVLLLTVGVVGAGLAYWFYSPPLTPAEQQLVGKWAMPTGPNPPPNAVLSVYDFGPDRRLTITSQVVGTGESAGTMTGTWRVEDGHLVLDALGEDQRPAGEKLLRGFGMSSSKLFGDAPEPPHMTARFRLLGWDDGAFQVEDEPGNVVPFHRKAD